MILQGSYIKSQTLGGYHHEYDHSNRNRNRTDTQHYRTFRLLFLGEKNKKRYKKSLIANCFLFFGVLLAATVVSFAGTASVQAASSADGLATGLGYLGAALVTGISGLGSGIAVASSASAALGALSEDGSLFGKSIIFVAMAEGIALYGLIISFMILGKL